MFLKGFDILDEVAERSDDVADDELFLSFQTLDAWINGEDAR